MTVRRHPNPITDCCHSAAGREGLTDSRERGVKGRLKSTTQGGHKTRHERGGEREKVKEKTHTKKLVQALKLRESVNLEDISRK